MDADSKFAAPIDQALTEAESTQAPGVQKLQSNNFVTGSTQDHIIQKPQRKRSEYKPNEHHGSQIGRKFNSTDVSSEPPVSQNLNY